MKFAWDILGLKRLWETSNRQLEMWAGLTRECLGGISVFDDWHLPLIK